MAELLSRRYPAEAESVRLVRHAVIDTLSASGFTDADFQFRVSSALTEATANVVRHAYPDDAQGYIDVLVDREARGEVVITISDRGVGMEARIGPSGMGLGLTMMRAQATSFGIQSDTGGTTVTLHFE